MSNRRHIYIEDYLWAAWSAHCKSVEKSASGGIRELVLGVIGPGHNEKQATGAPAGPWIEGPGHDAKENTCLA